MAVMSSNVDDLMHGCLPKGAEVINSVLQQFLIGEEEHNIFRFCRKEFRHDEDFGIHVTAKDNTERVQPITYDMKHGLTRKATADEIQSLAWIVRQTRLDLSYRISKIQRTFEKACVRSLRECNCIAECATSTSTSGIYVFLNFSWDDAVVVTISDASFCQEQEQIDRVIQSLQITIGLVSQL